MDFNLINIAAKVFSLVTMLQAKTWAMEPKALQQMFADVISMDDWPPENVEITSQEPEIRIDGNTAIIDIKGILMDEIPKAFSWRGIETTSYSGITEQIRQAVNDDNVGAILLRVNSPGGVADSGIIEAVDSIRAARDKKPVNAVISDLGASAAYWLTSQADHISIEANSETGSIGVYTVYSDTSGLYEKFGVNVNVIKSGEFKAMGVPGAPITDVQISAVKEIVDGIADNFVRDVAAGRKIEVEDARNLAVGRLWLANKAVEIGLVDEVIRTNSKTVIKNLKGNSMDKEKEKDAQTGEIEAANKKAAAQARAEERQRMADLKAAFPDDPEFAMKAFEAGQDVGLAKADYCDVLSARLKEKTDAAATAANAAAVTAGAKAVETEDTDSEGRVNFVTAAKELAKAEKIKLGEAYKRVAREQPELYQAHIAGLGLQRAAVA